MNYIIPNEDENNTLKIILDEINDSSEMSLSEKEFLNALIIRNKPKKILELGVAAGGSSAIILNAIKDDTEAFLYSIDYSSPYYRDSNKETGFIVKDRFPSLTNKWELFTPGLPANFIEKIGGDIDFCLIDTVHSNPGEILDYLMILPYLKKDAIVVFHDTCLHMLTERNKQCYTNCMLFSAIQGEKYLPASTEHLFINTGAIKLNTYANDAYSIFNLLFIPWTYVLNDNDYHILKKHFEKHYSNDCYIIFEKSKEYYDNALLAQEQKLNSTHIVANTDLAELTNNQKKTINYKNSLKNILRPIITPISRPIRNYFSQDIINRINILENNLLHHNTQSNKELKHVTTKIEYKKNVVKNINTKNIEIVIGDRNWILEEMANSIYNSNDVTITNLNIEIVDKCSSTADLAFYLPYTTFTANKAKISVANFTHQEIIQPNHDLFLSIAKECDFATVICKKYYDTLINSGISQHKLSLINIGVDINHYKPKIHIGIVGRTYPHSQRKGEHLMQELLSENISDIEFHFTGEGWPIESRYYDYNDMPTFYNQMDYILIPSLIEGGPACLYEALACGVPVISGDVGAVTEFPHIPFETGNLESLKKVLSEIVAQRNILRKSVENYTWQNFGEKHLELFKSLLLGDLK